MLKAHGENGEEYDFYAYVDKDRLETLKIKGVLEDAFLESAQDISPKPGGSIEKIDVSFTYQEPDALKDFDFGNTLIVASIPYCLHVPNGYEYQTALTEEKGDVLISLEKIWTSKATADGKLSSNSDFYAKDKSLYFQKSVVLTPKYPIKPVEGWRQNFTGTNIERIKEQVGVFRYTLLYIQLDTNYTLEVIDRKDAGALNEVKEIALKITNRLLDAYRFVTKEAHIQRLGTLEISQIYFKQHNQGFYISSTGFGIETARMNRSKEEFIEIGRLLKEDERPPLSDLLLLDAKSSADTRDFSLCVVQSFQALEIYLENLLINELKALSKTDQEISAYLGKYWRTKDRLREALRELKGKSLSDIDRKLWDEWCTCYEQIRNEVVHKGKEPSQKEAEKCLTKNGALLGILKTL